MEDEAQRHYTGVVATLDHALGLLANVIESGCISNDNAASLKIAAALVRDTGARVESQDEYRYLTP